jgi:hypothetical protein
MGAIPHHAPSCEASTGVYTRDAFLVVDGESILERNEGLDMTEHLEEGWYTDPFGRHEARWLSRGTPTKLVRDGRVEAYDEPPDEQPSVTPERIEADPDSSRGASDLLRADDVERGPDFDPKLAVRAASDVFDQTGAFGVAPHIHKPR